MIDPSDWRRELQRIGNKLTTHVQRGRVTPKGAVRLERELMVGYYLLHKLIEDQRISSELQDATCKLITFPSPGRMEILTHPSLTPLVLRSRGPQTEFKIGVLTNKIIHAYLIAVLKGSPLRVAICSEFEHYDRIIVANLHVLVANLQKGANF